MKEILDQYLNHINAFMNNIEKWSGILKKPCVVKTARFAKYVWLFFNITHGRVNYFRIGMKRQAPLRLKC